MRKFGIGLAAVLALLVMAPATTAFAAKKPAAAAGGVDAKSREKGMADTPAIVAAAGFGCTVSDARWIGADAKSKQAYYEIACDPGMGGILVAAAAAPPAFYPCLETAKPGPDGKPNALTCKLPANLSPVQSLAPFMAKAGVPCTIEDARSIGSSPKNVFFEVACQGGAGYVLVTSAPPDASKEAKANTCLAYEAGTTLACQLTSLESQLAMADSLAAASGKNCTVTGKRYILTAVSGAMYFEVACQGGKGYVLERAVNGSLARAIDCANAPGGADCTLTDAREAQTEQAGLYSRLAAKAGFVCAVEKYALFPARAAREEVVELKCSDRPDGAIAMFDANGGGKVYNCILAELRGYRCSFSPKEAAMPKLSADLKGLGKGSCVVSDARPIGANTAGEGFVEVACSDGLPGWVMVYPSNTNVAREVLSCRQASGVGGGCKLATNKVSN